MCPRMHATEMESAFKIEATVQLPVKDWREETSC